MSFIISKVKRTGEIIYNHKKKCLFGVGLMAYGITYLQSYNRDNWIRLCYAREAVKHGEQPIIATQQLQRVTVLLNDEANGRKVSDLFNKNALPLLNLAGIDVNIVKPKSEEEMENLGRVLDRTETDCIYIVGGDGTVARVVKGIMTGNREFNANNTAPVPICIFPGGRRNLFLRRILPGIFGEDDDVRRYCENAMAIIEDSRRTISPIKCEIINNADADQSQTHYLLSSFRTGWFEYCEQRKPKMWYVGALRSRFVYFLEFLKRYPEPLSVRLCYDEFCSGCNRCREPIVAKTPIKSLERRSWLSMLFGMGKKKNMDETVIKAIDYSNVMNDKCGTQHELSIDCTDLNVVCTQEEDCSGLKFQSSGSFPNRFIAMRNGWARESQQDSAASIPSKFFDTEFMASKIAMEFRYVPEFIQKLSVAGDWTPFENIAEKSVRLETTNKKIGIFLSKTPESRLKLEDR